MAQRQQSRAEEQHQSQIVSVPRGFVFLFEEKVGSERKKRERGHTTLLVLLYYFALLPLFLAYPLLLASPPWSPTKHRSQSSIQTLQSNSKPPPTPLTSTINLPYLTKLKSAPHYYLRHPSTTPRAAPRRRRQARADPHPKGARHLPRENRRGVGQRHIQGATVGRHGEKERVADKIFFNSPLRSSDADTGGGGGEEAVGDAEVGDGERAAPALFVVRCIFGGLLWDWGCDGREGRVGWESRVGVFVCLRMCVVCVCPLDTYISTYTAIIPGGVRRRGISASAGPAPPPACS